MLVEDAKNPSGPSVRGNDQLMLDASRPGELPIIGAPEGTCPIPGDVPNFNDAE